MRACVPIRQGEEITTQYRKGSLRQELRNVSKFKEIFFLFFLDQNPEVQNFLSDTLTDNSSSKVKKNCRQCSLHVVENNYCSLFVWEKEINKFQICY